MMRRAVFALVAVPVLGCLHDWSLPLAVGVADADVGLADAAVVDDAHEGDARGPCEGSLLCDRFDGLPLDATWDGVTVAPGGRVAIEPFAAAVSPPNVLVAERPAQDDGGSTAYIAKVLRQPLTRARMELALSPSMLDATAFTTVAAIVFDHQGAGEHKIRLALRQDGAQLQELDPSSVVASHELPRALPIDAWSRVAIEVEAGGNVRVSVDGVSVIDVAAAPSWRPSGRTLIVAGINFVTGPHQAIRVRIDDVRIDGS